MSFPDRSFGRIELEFQFEREREREGGRENILELPQQHPNPYLHFPVRQGKL